MQNMLHLLYDRNNRDKKKEAIEYADRNNVNPSVIQAIGSTSGIKVKVKENQKGEIAVCEFFEELKEEGRIEGGAQQIVRFGMEFKMPENDIIARLQKELGVTLNQAEEYLKIFGGQA